MNSDASLSTTSERRKLLTVITPCYNEEANVREMAEAIRELFVGPLSKYDYEHIFIDNASRDRTASLLRELAARDPRIKVILNTRNFGHVRSPYHAFLRASGDAVIGLAADFQDPPTLIPEFVAKWEAGAKVVMAVRTGSDESFLLAGVRSFYYKLVARLSSVEIVKNATGFGMYDKAIIDVLRRIEDPYPYFRGLISDIGYPVTTIPFHRPQRKRGLTSNNFYTLYDMAMLGITNHSKVPLRMATMAGFGMGTVSLLVAIGYLVAKLLFWYSFTVGIAPIIISLFFFSSVQLFFIGIIGEYIGAIHTYVQKRPLVIESESINFDRPATSSRISVPPPPPESG
ncbi:MAG TPA: glycosyltransferase family 2 protein [Planctomycetaceae bacterium]|jgi:glycosyltransferase involved in cell wall biosynthesis|nr:glycosyltransferase family 2 protein [Planctomycetaceae bacterium]